MSLKKIKQVRADRGFKLWDIAIYASLAVIILSLFIAFVFTRPSSPLTTVCVTYGYGQSSVNVCTYSFSSGAVLEYDTRYITVDSSTPSGTQVTFSDGEHYNVIWFDNQNCTASVTSANCPSQDCVHSWPISNNSSPAIYCVAHALVISPEHISGSVIM